MSLKYNKRLILCFCVLMALILIPTSFATDVNEDASGVNMSAEDTIAESSDDVVIKNTSNLVGVSAGHNDDVISQNNNDKDVVKYGDDYYWISTPSPSSVDYTLGESKTITVNMDSDSFDYISGSDSMKVYINGASSGTAISGVFADAKSFTFDLKTISDKLNDGKNTLVFHPDVSVLYDADIYNIDYDELTVQVGGSDVGNYLYVSTTGNDTTGDGSEDKPYATIDKAITVNNDKGGDYTVLVNEGTYVISKYMSKSISIKGLGNVIIDQKGSSSNYLSISSNYNYVFSGLTIINSKGSTATISGSSGSSSSGTLKVYNCTFINNSATTSIMRIYAGASIQGCIFVNNTANGASSYYGWGIISALNYNVKGGFDLNNNIFMNNTVNAKAPIIYNYRTSTLNAKDNYWGSNDGIDSSKLSGEIDASSWVALVTSINNDEVSVGDKPTITTQFKSTTDGKTFTDLSGVMPNFTVSATSNIGTVDSKTTITNNIGNINYTATKDGEETVNIIYNGNVLSSLDLKLI